MALIPFNSPEYPKELHESIHDFAYHNSYEIVPYKNRSLVFTNHFFFERLNKIATEHLLISVNVTPYSLGPNRWVRADEERRYTLNDLTRFFQVQTSFRISYCSLTNSENEKRLPKFDNVKCLEIDNSTLNYGLFHRIRSWGSKIKILRLSNVKIHKAHNKNFKSLGYQIKKLKNDPKYKEYQAIEYLFYSIKNIPLECLSIDNMALSDQSIINICGISSIKELDFLGIYSVNYNPDTLIANIHKLSSLKTLRIDLRLYTFEQVYKLLTTLYHFFTLDKLEISFFSEDHILGQDIFQVNEVYRCLFYTAKRLRLNSSVIRSLDLSEFDIQHLKCKKIALSHTYIDPSIYTLLIQKGPLDIVECSKYNTIELAQYPEWAQDNYERIYSLSALNLNRLYFISNEQIEDLASLSVQAKSLYLNRCRQLDATSILNFITQNATVENLYLLDIFPYTSPKSIHQFSFIEFVYWTIQSVYVSNNTTIKKIIFTYERDARIPNVLNELRRKVPKSLAQFKRIKKGFEIHFPIRNEGLGLFVNWLSLDSVEIDLNQNYYSELFENLSSLKGIDKISYRNFQQEDFLLDLNFLLDNDDIFTSKKIEELLKEAIQAFKLLLTTSNSVQFLNSSLSNQYISMNQVLIEPAELTRSKPSVLYADYSSLQIEDIEYLFFSIERFSHFVDTSFPSAFQNTGSIALDNEMTQDQIESSHLWYSQIAQFKFEALSILHPSAFLSHNSLSLKAKDVSLHNLKEENLTLLLSFLNQSYEIQNLVLYFDTVILPDTVSSFLSQLDHDYDQIHPPKKSFVFKAFWPNTFIEDLSYGYQHFEVHPNVLSSNEVILHIIDKFEEPIDQFEDKENRVINEPSEDTMDDLIRRFKNISLE